MFYPTCNRGVCLLLHNFTKESRSNIRRIKTAEAAVIMGCSPQFVRVGMQRGILDIGNAIKMSSIWTYNISAAALAKRQGMTTEELARTLEEIRKKDT